MYEQMTKYNKLRLSKRGLHYSLYLTGTALGIGSQHTGIFSIIRAPSGVRQNIKGLCCKLRKRYDHGVLMSQVNWEHFGLCKFHVLILGAVLTIIL